MVIFASVCFHLKEQLLVLKAITPRMLQIWKTLTCMFMPKTYRYFFSFQSTWPNRNAREGRVNGFLSESMFGWELLFTFPFITSHTEPQRSRDQLHLMKIKTGTFWVKIILTISILHCSQGKHVLGSSFSSQTEYAIVWKIFIPT